MVTTENVTHEEFEHTQELKVNRERERERERVRVRERERERERWE